MAYCFLISDSIEGGGGSSGGGVVVVRVVVVGERTVIGAVSSGTAPNQNLKTSFQGVSSSSLPFDAEAGEEEAAIKDISAGISAMLYVEAR